MILKVSYTYIATYHVEFYRGVPKMRQRIPVLDDFDGRSPSSWFLNKFAS